MGSAEGTAGLTAPVAAAGPGLCSAQQQQPGQQGSRAAAVYAVSNTPAGPYNSSVLSSSSSSSGSRSASRCGSSSSSKYTFKAIHKKNSFILAFTCELPTSQSLIREIHVDLHWKGSNVVRFCIIQWNHRPTESSVIR